MASIKTGSGKIATISRVGNKQEARVGGLVVASYHEGEDLTRSEGVILGKGNMLEEILSKFY